MMNIYEHWIEPDGNQVLIPVDTPNWRRILLLSGEGRLCCCIAAWTPDEACRLYHEHLGREPHPTMEPAS